MSATIGARGGSLPEALRVAVADLLDCEVDEVKLELQAAGLAEITGEVRLELQIDDDEGSDARSGGEAVPAGALAEDPAPIEDADEADEEADDEPSQELSVEQLDEEADAAADFLEGLLDAMDLPGDLRIKVHEDHAEVEVLEIGSGALIGRRGQTLEAIQELVRCALQRQFERRCRVKVDAEGYRARRLEKLLEKAEEAIESVLETGEAERLEPMDVFERKAIHHLVAANEGVMSRSQGREPARRVIIEREE